MNDSRPTVFRRAKQAYLTPEAFAEHFDVSKMTVYRLIHGGEIRANRIGRAFRIPVAELARFADCTQVTPEDPSPATTQQETA